MLKAGFSRLDITPPLGADLSGYFSRRISDGILDPLFVNTVSVNDGENTLILMALDYIGVKLNYADKIRDHIAGRLGIPREFVYVASLHQHTSPCLDDNRDTRLRDEAFKDVLIRRLGDSAVYASQDMKPAKLFAGSQTV